MAELIDRVAKTFGLTTQEENDNKKLASDAVYMWKADARARRTVELEWWRNDNFIRGENFVFNKNTSTLEQRKLKDKIFVNKARQQVRGVVSYINKEHPFIAIQPGVQSDSAYSNAKNMQHMCTCWYDRLEMNKTNKKVTKSGARIGLGWSKILWDPSAKVDVKPNGGVSQVTGEVTYDYCDPYDVYPDPRMTSWDDCRRITHVLPRTIGELRGNPKFPKERVDQVAADDKLASSELKESVLMRGTGLINESESINPDLRTTLLLEQYIKEYDENGAESWRVTYATANGTFLHSEKWELNFNPFEYYQTDVCDNIYDSDGAVKHIRPLNEALNRSASQMEDNADRMGKLHYVTEKGSGIRVIHDKVGTIMEVNGGKRYPEQVKPSGMPSYVENHQANLERWIDDEGGIHDATRGKSPFSRASGEAIKGLQEGDSNSLAMYRDNFDDYMVRVFKKMFATEKHFRAKQQIGRSIRVPGENGVDLYSWIEVKPKDISLDNEIQVRSGTNFPFSNSERQAMVLDLKDKGLFDGSPSSNTALKLMNLPEVENVMGNEQPHIERQAKELKDFLAGKEVDDPVVAENHAVHIRVIDQFINAPGWYKADVRVRRNIMEHRRLHADMQEQNAKAAAALNLEPIKRSEVININPKNFNELTPVERVQVLSKFGIASDMDEIQARGGLTIQNPEEAMQQADIENQLMVAGNAPRVSLGDNHQVHLEAHNLLKNSPDYEKMGSTAKFLDEHIKQHEMVIQTLQATPGLIPNSQSGSTVPDHSIKTGEEKAKIAQGEAEEAEPPMPQDA